ncbi:type II secretion system F family protein [Nocardioides sp.]|uniref:type II secretion system F family protein n=1 Tax=Nocardioides sp. TaxID=35761 RepID=UPI002B269054|nr:type II secretion system F family protein [Nocardioides sp.]
MTPAAVWQAAWAVVAVSCAGGAVVLMAPAVAQRPRAPSGREEAAARGGPAMRALVGVGAVAVVAVAGLVAPRQVALAAIVVVAGLVGWVLVRRRRQLRSAERTSARLLEACEQLTGELVAGRPPGVALEQCAAHWHPVAPVAEAFRVGADVPGAWREVARRPGAADLRLVAAAWQVSHRTGAGLASALEQVTADLRAQRATRRVVAGELASARATARLVAVLPLLALTFGAGAGGDPWTFLLTHPIGLACLGLGLAFGLGGLAWIEALARQVDRS